MTAYPDREHERAASTARSLALGALSEIEYEVTVIRRRIESGTAGVGDTRILAERAREVTEQTAVLAALRWPGSPPPAGMTVEGIAVWDAATGEGAPVIKIAPGAVTFGTEEPE